MRGQSRKLKVLESAREAVLHIESLETKLNLIIGRAAVDAQSQIVPDSKTKSTNGDGNVHHGADIEREVSITPLMKDRHDISYAPHCTIEFSRSVC